MILDKIVLRRILLQVTQVFATLNQFSITRFCIYSHRDICRSHCVLFCTKCVSSPNPKATSDTQLGLSSGTLREKVGHYKNSRHIPEEAGTELWKL